MNRGVFITLEGPEGGGKTTQARRLVAKLEKAGHKVMYTREPGGTPTGEAIRDILQHDVTGEPICPRTEVLLFAASRAQLVDHVIAPALAEGTIVVSDRFADSTTVYQGYGRSFGVEQMLAINDFAIATSVPDLTILLDLEVDLGFERLRERQKQQATTMDRMEREARDFHVRVRDGYLDLARRFPDRFRIVDASGTLDEVETLVWKEVEVLFAGA